MILRVHLVLVLLGGLLVLQLQVLVVLEMVLAQVLLLLAWQELLLLHCYLPLAGSQHNSALLLLLLLIKPIFNTFRLHLHSNYTLLLLWRIRCTLLLLGQELLLMQQQLLLLQLLLLLKLQSMELLLRIHLVLHSRRLKFPAEI